ncbi:signal recognition particle protein sec65 [Ophiostoma piceae UAMH 11346]|uniref:Signal recognition particle protein sec65 n=1 Tax=Ophiostoma piceae (strain UAMH 11346) TaxID=1262450 RepID=S3CSY2_OPHP1|nr:signal recognition particle protein sec65 [Ophiostoma piceae UAMH 11346]
MSRRPQIEEIEDSDDAFSDPSEDDIDDFVESDIIRRKETPAAASRPSAQQSQPPPFSASSQPTLAQLQALAQAQQQMGGADSTGLREAPEGYNGFPALYPIYFDKNRSRAEGRRVSKALAVANPLARTLVDACAELRLPTVFEPSKTHPKDWANPGRVKVDLDAASAATKVNGKHHLYILVAKYLASHPTTERSAGLRDQVRGMPPPPPSNEPYPRPAVPRGWKLPELVPYLSPAMSGGGVSDNLFEDVMKGMQGLQGAGGAGGMPNMQQAMAALAGGGGMGALGAPGAAAGDTKKVKKGKGKA